jgi:single-strand DNA-binding protein
MSTLRNRVQLIGNIGKNPEIVTLESGKKLAKFSLATNESYKTKTGERVTDTQWHNLIAWGPTATIIEKYCTKGQEIAIEGKLNHTTYEKEGVKHYKTDIVVNVVQLLSKADTNPTTA